jgi:beta propeller repeat protein
MSSETCATWDEMGLRLMHRQSGDTTELSECWQHPETIYLTEDHAAWVAQPTPTHNKDVYFHDLATGITEHVESTGPGSQYFPHAEGDAVVWQDSRDGRREIYRYTISTGIEEVLTPDEWEQAWPHLRHGIVAFSDYSYSQESGEPGRCDIAILELATGAYRRVTSESRKWQPRYVDAGWILYVEQIPGGEHKLYAHDLVSDGILTADGHVIP